MRGVSWLAVAVMALGAPAVAQGVVYVDGNAPPGGDGGSWSTAHGTLQAGLAAAVGGESVWVAAGSYGGGFVVPAGVSVVGGFAPGATRVTQARPMVRSTTLDGGGSQRVLVLGQGSVVDGFVVQNGAAPAPGGGGALIDGVVATMRNCVFVNNRNDAGRGSAVYVTGGANPLVQNCLLYRNLNTGHTIDVDGGSAGVYDHLTVFENQENGLHMSGAVTCVITNCIFGRNWRSGVCDVGDFNQPVLHNSLFFGNTVSMVHYRGIELRTAATVNGFLSYASNNIDGDPLFRDSANGDYRLVAGSPAIDTGTGSGGVAADAFGTARAIDGDLDGVMVTDIGFHEYCNVELDVSGNLQGGGQLKVSVSGDPSLGVLLVLSPSVGSGVGVPPLGSLYLGAPLVLLPMANPPSSVDLPIPSGARGDVGLQVLGANVTAGNLSNVIDARIR